jgi:hypothetical protein
MCNYVLNIIWHTVYIQPDLCYLDILSYLLPPVTELWLAWSREYRETEDNSLRVTVVKKRYVSGHFVDNNDISIEEYEA